MLASVQEIKELSPMENADNLVLAKVLEWNVVVRKDEFNVGDFCVFFQIDSKLPDKPVFDFMKPRKFRVRSTRLRGVLSQGLCMPMSILSEFPIINEGTGVYKVGDDVTEVIGVESWFHNPEDAGYDGTGHRQTRKPSDFPSFIPKTDEKLMQSVPGVIEELTGHPYYITTKVDGSSCTIANLNGEIYVCSRRRIIKNNEDSFTKWWFVHDKYDVSAILKIAGNYAIQGELCGPGIQKNLLGLDEFDLYVFNVFNIDKGAYVDYTRLTSFCNYYGFKMVPFIEEGDSFNYSADELVEKARGNYESGNLREGIVVRPKKEMFSRALKNRLSFKVMNNDFLLKG